MIARTVFLAGISGGMDTWAGSQIKKRNRNEPGRKRGSGPGQPPQSTGQIVHGGPVEEPGVISSGSDDDSYGSQHEMSYRGRE